jgi:hypothetical protein
MPHKPKKKQGPGKRHADTEDVVPMKHKRKAEKAATVPMRHREGEEEPTAYEEALEPLKQRCSAWHELFQLEDEGEFRKCFRTIMTAGEEVPLHAPPSHSITHSNTIYHPPPSFQPLLVPPPAH